MPVWLCALNIHSLELCLKQEQRRLIGCVKGFPVNVARQVVYVWGCTQICEVPR